MKIRYQGSLEEQIDLLSLPRDSDDYLEKSRKFNLWLDCERGCDRIYIASMDIRDDVS